MCPRTTDLWPLAWVVLLVWLCPACDTPSKPLVQPEKPAAPAPAPAQAHEETQAQTMEETPKEHMRDHFGIVMQARDALIRGDLAGAHGPLVWLSQHNYGGEVPSAWVPHVARMQAAARKAEAAGSTDVLARELVGVASACGACHVALGKPATFEPAGFEDLGESERESTQERMHRHLWAVNRMWEALIGPDPKRFAMAGQLLVEAPSELEGEASESVRRGIAQVRALGKRAMGASTTAAQAEVLAAFLGQCAGCHKGSGP